MSLLAITAGIAFAACANAMAKTAAEPPPFVQYRQTIHETAKVLKVEKTFEYTVLRRTSDGRGFLTLDDGRTAVFMQPFLIPPTFDALSDFTIHGEAHSDGSFKMWVQDVRPLTYTLRQDVDAVSIAVKRYSIALAGDSTDEISHIHFTPLGDDTPIHPRMYFKDVWCERETNFVRRAEFVGPEERSFVVDYAVSEGRPIVSHFQFAQTYSRMAGIIRARLTVDATYDHYAYPVAVPDSTFERKLASPAPG